MISIAIATYNGERFLREQLDSLYQQTRLPDEVVVSDDGSTDGTIAILEEYHQNRGLRYEVNPGRHGVNGNFEHAFRMAKGDYVMICDQDDVWFPEKVQVLAKTIEQEDQTMMVAVSSSRVDVDAEGRVITQPVPETTGTAWFDTYLHTGCSQGCTMILNRALVDKMLSYYSEKAEESQCYLYDVLASMLAATFGKKINLATPLMYYRHHDKNVVDPLRKGPYTFWQKVEDMPTYYPFLLDYRIHELAQSASLFCEEPMRAEIRCFLEKMVALDGAKNIFQGLSIVLSLKEIDRILKFKTVLLTPVVRTLKMIRYAYCQSCSRH